MKKEGKKCEECLANNISEKHICDPLMKALNANHKSSQSHIIEGKCEHGVFKKYCFRCKRPDLAGAPPLPQEEKCDCESLTCPVGCTRKHTHKKFWCEKCHPERYSSTFPEKKLVKVMEYPNWGFAEVKESNNEPSKDGNCSEIPNGSNDGKKELPANSSETGRKLAEKDGNGGWEERFARMVMKIDFDAPLSVQDFEKCKSFIASEIRLAEERLVARLLKEKVWDTQDGKEYVTVESIISIAKGEE